MKPLVVIAMLAAACVEERTPPMTCDDDCEPRIHPAGILDPAAEAFHGKELARRAYDFAVCARCHGDAFDGGTAQVSCLTCHAEGPTACVTCHRDGPTTAAHPVHATSSVACGECHRVPERWDDPGHLTGDSGVTFGAKAGASATWTGERCDNVYCHGDTLGAGGSATRPRWDAVPSGGCNSCHASPPPDHARTDCATCHAPAAPHIDTIVQVGVGCSDCHGDATTPAPATGAHRAHVLGLSRLAAPIACATCHEVPATRDAAGHLDAGPAQVRATIGWDRMAQTCTASCHGPARPAWSSTGLVTCGTCHAVPPATPSHATATSLSTCVNCHPEGGHVDGDVDTN